MKPQAVRQTYSWWIIIISNIIPLSIYVLGGMFMSWTGYFRMALYIGFVFFIETRLLATSCPEYYYYGKWCAFGRGKLSSHFFRKGLVKSLFDPFRI